MDFRLADADERDGLTIPLSFEAAQDLMKDPQVILAIQPATQQDAGSSSTRRVRPRVELKPRRRKQEPEERAPHDRGEPRRSRVPTTEESRGGAGVDGPVMQRMPDAETFKHEANFMKEKDEVEPTHGAR
jgi:hypothetical protein